MNLHEYQAKIILKNFGLPILNGKSYFKSLDSISEDIVDLKGPPWVVKSQIHAGGRGAGHFKKSFNQKGGVQVLFEKDQVFNIAESMMGNILITKQTGDQGKKVNRIFIEEGCEIDREFYLSLLIDRNTSKIMLMISAAGGVDIEEVAVSHPEKIINIYLDEVNDIKLDESLQKKLDINHDQFDELTDLIKKLLLAFIAIDATSIEINPLVLNKDGKFVVLDAKISLDDNALFRHPELAELKDLTEEDPLELQATEHDMNYVKLDGSIGCMVNGAGLAMATMDIIKQYGEEPANFLDLGGTANKERVKMGFKIIQSDPNVKSILINIFGGIIHCDMIANGIVEAVKDLNFKLPLVVRFQGTNASQGRDVINESALGLISVDDFTEAAKKVVELARGS
jgi:succinyl-CoA synthetase beta subunit